MKRVIIILGCIFALNSACAEDKLDNSIIQTIQKNMLNISIASYSFCVHEFAFVLKQDSSILTIFYEAELKRLAYLKSSKDIYLSELLQIQFLKDSLISYYLENKEDYVIKNLIDFFEEIPEYEIQKDDYHLFFESFTDESGVGAEKIETLLATQDLYTLFEYIRNNEKAKKRFLEWIDEEIEVWCPAFDTNNAKWDDKIVRCLYNRLCEINDTLARQAADKLKIWFGL